MENAFEKQTKNTDEHGGKQTKSIEEHGVKQLVVHNDCDKKYYVNVYDRANKKDYWFWYKKKCLINIIIKDWRK